MTNRQLSDQLRYVNGELRALRRAMLLLAEELVKNEAENEPESRAWQRSAESGEPQQLPDGTYTSNYLPF